MRVVPVLVLVLVLARGAASAYPDDPPARMRPVRVLLLASAAGREYQFLRTTLLRRGAEHKITTTQILLSRDGKEGKIVERGDEKILTAFPDTFETKPGQQSAEAAAFNLASYDAIIAFDPDWSRLSAAQQGLLRKWVEKGGGLIVLAGDIHTPALASPAKRQALRTIVDLYPVVLDDPRLRLLDEKPATQPRRLTLTEAGKELRLGDEDKGWDRFHGKTKENVPERGFYRAFPVVAVKPGATTLAVLDGATPFLVRARVGAGQVVYVGGQELWRIRQARQDWYETLWEGLIRHTAGK